MVEAPDVFAPAVWSRIEALSNDLAALPGVISIVDPLSVIDARITGPNEGGSAAQPRARNRLPPDGLTPVYCGMRREDREQAMVEVTCRVLRDTLAAAERGGPSVEQILHDTIYEERKRLERAGRSTPRRDQDRAFVERVRARITSAGPEQRKALLKEVVAYFTDEIAGKFDPRVYALATKAVPRALALMLNALSPRKLLGQLPDLPRLSSNVIIRGEIDTVRRLDKLGTIILCPTHLSNLDSPVIGWGLYAAGLSPHVYGAGINLFTNPLLTFFMHNLGAYRVDRRKKAALYKQILKAYCTTTMEMGYDNLFFPGGTRSRSGGIEPRLKLGLLGCGLQSYVNNLLHDKEKPNIYVVPCTLSYQLVLEAETLIGDYLKETGKARYVIEDDESSQIGSWLRFLSGVASMDSRIYLTFSSPLDLFGNRVGADGRSYDARGRVVDTTRYVTDASGTPVHDAGRDREYTKELGVAVRAAYKRDNVLQSTHIAAYTMFSLLRRAEPETDLYRLLRTAGDTATVSWTGLAQAADRVLNELKRLSDGPSHKVRIDPRVRAMSADGVIEDAIRAFATYHQRKAIYRRGDRVYSGDMNLLFYYHNRATGYDLGAHVDARPAPPSIDLARRPGGDLVLPSSAPTEAARPHERSVPAAAAPAGEGAAAGDAAAAGIGS